MSLMLVTAPPAPLRAMAAVVLLAALAALVRRP
jgi:hypothetical protein